MKAFALIGLAFLLSACAGTPTHSTSHNLPPLNTLYDFRVIDAKSGKILTVEQLARQTRDADVVFIGEYHGNQASHLLEAELQAALYRLRPKQILSMEQFNRDHQVQIDRYLDGEIGEKVFIKNSNAWPNYAGSYRPMVEFAKQHYLPVIAANAPLQTVRCVGRQGKPYLEKLHANEKQAIAAKPFLSNPQYRQKFSEFQQQTKPDSRRRQNQYDAQLLRDNTMAESILQALNAYPGYQVIHLNGAFHSDGFLGTVALLKQRRPDLKIAVISPIRVDNPQKPTYAEEDLSKGNYLYLVQPQPLDYVQSQNRRAAFARMFKAADEKQCR